jgi:hypothetical protein
MPIAMKEEQDLEIVQVTPPTPHNSLPKVNEKYSEDKKPVLEMNEKSEMNAMDEKERVRQQRQADIDQAMKTIRQKRDE